MFALRYAALLALVLWVGGLLALGAIAAPATFDVLGAAGAEGRTTAGAVFGESLRRFALVAYACGGVLIVSLLARAVLGPRPRPFGIRLGAAAVMLASMAWLGMVIAPRIEQARRETGASMTTLAPTDPQRAAFERLHRLSTSLALVPVVGGLALLFFELRD